MIRFRERMVGLVGPVPGSPWVLRPRGPRGADGIVETVASTEGTRPDMLDLGDLHVAVDGIDPLRDGFVARVLRGTVTGIGTTRLPVDCGFADVLMRSHGGRSMHYRLLVVHGTHGYVVDGVKTVRGGLLAAWSGTTTLHTIVVRVDARVVLPAADRAAWLADGGFSGEVVSAGVLRVRGLVRQGLSLRGGVPCFLFGFALRALRV